MTTLREKILRLVENKYYSGGSLPPVKLLPETVTDQILAAVIEHATSDEAVERGWDELEYAAGDGHARWKSAIRSAIGGE